MPSRDAFRLVSKSQTRLGERARDRQTEREKDLGMQHFPQAREKNARETYFDAIGRSRRAITVIILRRHSFNVSQSGCIEVDEGRLVVIFFFASFSIASLLISLSFCLVGLLLSSSGCVLVRSVNAVQHYSRLFGESLFNAFSRSSSPRAIAKRRGLTIKDFSSSPTLDYSI